MGKRTRQRTLPREIEIVPGFTLTAYRSPVDGALVLELDGAPEGDEDCERVRVYINEGLAIKWVTPADPEYPDVHTAKES